MKTHTFLNVDLISHLSDQTGAKYMSTFKNVRFLNEKAADGRLCQT